MKHCTTRMQQACVTAVMCWVLLVSSTVASAQATITGTAIPSHFYVDKTGVLREMRQGSVSAETIPTSLKGLMNP